MSEQTPRKRQLTTRRLLLVITVVAVAAAFFRFTLGTEYLWVQVSLIALIGFIAAIATRQDFTASKPLGAPKWAYRGGFVAGFGFALFVSLYLSSGSYHPGDSSVFVVLFISAISLMLLGRRIATWGNEPGDS